jgi:hypothetical protein
MREKRSSFTAGQVFDQLKIKQQTKVFYYNEIASKSTIITMNYLEAKDGSFSQYEYIGVEVI